MQTCQWCRASAESDAVVTATLQRYCTGGPAETEDANCDLAECLECVVEYHKARESVPTLHKHLWELETSRLLCLFRKLLEEMEKDDDLCFVENGEEQPIFRVSPDECNLRLRFPMIEVLMYPYLLCHQGLSEMVVNMLCKLEDMKIPLQLRDKYPGIYLLMVHPNETVRRWAISTARSLERVDRDSCYDLQEVFSCMFYVIELGISLEVPDMDNTSCTGKLKLMPSHLYDSKNEKNYWLGICMLLMQLDSQAMDSLFMEKLSSIPQCILNTMTENRKGEDMGSDPFWPAFHCFMIILDRLGSKIWCQIEPEDAFRAITQADSYMAEIENIRQKTSETKVKVEPNCDDDILSCSQMVYDCYPTERTNRSLDWSSSRNDNNINEIFEEMGCLINDLQSEMGQSLRVYGSTFLWFVPFVRSVMELGELGLVYVNEVINHLYKEMDKDVISGQTLDCDKVTEFFTRILVEVVELLFSKGNMRMLYCSSSIWVKVVVQCSLLDETISTRHPDRRGGSHKVSWTSFERGNRILETGVGAMSLACMKLIRSLLKKGGRTGTAPEFLDRLNKQLREIQPRAWTLTPSQSENLQACLNELVRTMMDRTADLATIPSAPPTPPADPPEYVSHPKTTLSIQEPQYRDIAAGPSGAGDKFIKEEPPWPNEKDQEDFCENPEDRPKKEPRSPVLISEFQPTLERNSMKPDLGKIEEIKSRLNDRQNLSKIQAIAKRGLVTEKKQNAYSDLKEAPHFSANEATSQPSIPDSDKKMKLSKKKGDECDDDEPLIGDVCKRRLKKSRLLCNESSDEANYSGSAPGVHGSNSTITSGGAANDQTAEKDSSSDGATKRVTCDLNADLNDSPGRDYDDDLSESQVFEFETQESIASVWSEYPVLTKRPKHEPTTTTSNTSKATTSARSKTSSSCDLTESRSSWVNETQPVTDEDIEFACQQVEQQIGKHQQLQDLPPLNMSGTKPAICPEKENGFIQLKSALPQSPTTKPSHADKKGQQVLSKKSVLIEPVAQKVKKRHWSQSSLALVVPPLKTPAIVPPKKVRKPIESESVAERMGLKKKERKAFDLSQRSLDTLGELRTHGQNVYVEQKKAKKRLHPKSKAQVGKGGKKLLASQDMQYFRQSRGMLQKPTATTTLRNPKPETLSKPKGVVKEPEENEEAEEEDDYFFLPCSQPDPSWRTERSDKHTKHGMSESSNIESVTPDKSSSLQNNKGVKESDGSTAKCAETVMEHDCDSEWLYLTQNEPTDMELCSQIEEMETWCEDRFNDQRDPVDVDHGTDNQPGGHTDVKAKSAPVSLKAHHTDSTRNSVNDCLFLKPGMSPMSQKKAKPSTTKIYAGSSRSASLIVEMEKTSKPPVNVLKMKAGRPLPAVAPPPAPPVSKGMPAPPVSKGMPAPSVGKGMPAPPISKGMPAPPISKGMPAPPVSKGMPAPPVSKGMPAPPVSKGMPAPPVSKGVPAPPVPKGVPAPPVPKGVSAPPVPKLALTHPVSKAMPPPPVPKNAPAHPVSKAMPSPKVPKTAPAHPVSKAMPPPPVPKFAPAPPVSKAMPPPPAIPEFRQPLPCSRTPHPPTQAMKSFASINVASHPPSYKAYSRPERPASMARTTASPSQRYDQSVLTQAILKWEFHMFENYKHFGTPDDLCPLPLKEVPTRFTDYQEYFNILYPLLLVNVFEEMVSEWLKSGRIKLHLKLQGLEYSSRAASASFTASLNPQQEMKQLYPKEDDLVLLWLPENSGAYEPEAHVPQAHFGCVSRSNVISNDGGQPSTLNLTVQTRGNVSSVDAQFVQCEVIGSLVSTLREFRALCLLRSGIMSHPYILLKPNISVFAPSQEVLPGLDMPEYNPDQAKAINCGVAMVKMKQRSPKILLIHGPPGTGKSKTIVGLLHRLFSDHSEAAPVNPQSRTRKMRVLLCAPSNAAIDSLMKKVILTFKSNCRNIHSPQGNCGDINLVRLGNEKTISKSLVPFSLDSRIAKKTQTLQDSDVQSRMEKLDQVIDVLTQQCARTPKQSNEFKQLMEKNLRFLSERKNLSQQLREHRSKRQELQAGILQNAHVICCTLSTSGSIVLESAFRRLGHEPFSCVIVDEAGQAKETETLIPLLHRCPVLILVGDPKQLPPTVVSQKAKELGYDQSLMARLCESLRQSNPQAPPTIFLCLQYRMHPDICEFPAKYIYNKILKTDWADECPVIRHMSPHRRQLYSLGLLQAACNCGETAQKRCSVRWPFVPYRVFDVTDGRESKENDSFSNQKEVKLVLMLLKLIGEKVRVGVITPYNAQKQRIRKEIAYARKDCKYPIVEVDTVDGFQGQEMDCIIVSCVRASKTGSIGFVGNCQRMNVTITRAKFSLFILGHIRTLREQHDWGALIRDAISRGTIINTQESDFQEAATKILKPSLLARSHSHPPVVWRHSSPTLHHPDSTGSHTHTHSSGHSSPPAMPDWPQDPRVSFRPSDPRLAEPTREMQVPTDRRSRPLASGSHRRAYHRPQPPSGSAHSSRSPQRLGHERRSSSSPKKRYKRELA